MESNGLLEVRRWALAIINLHRIATGCASIVHHAALPRRFVSQHTNKLDEILCIAANNAGTCASSRKRRTPHSAAAVVAAAFLLGPLLEQYVVPDSNVHSPLARPGLTAGALKASKPAVGTRNILNEVK